MASKYGSGVLFTYHNATALVSKPYKSNFSLDLVDQNNFLERLDIRKISIQMI